MHGSSRTLKTGEDRKAAFKVDGVQHATQDKGLVTVPSLPHLNGTATWAQAYRRWWHLAQAPENGISQGR